MKLNSFGARSSGAATAAASSVLRLHQAHHDVNSFASRVYNQTFNDIQEFVKYKHSDQHDANNRSTNDHDASDENGDLFISSSSKSRGIGKSGTSQVGSLSIYSHKTMQQRQKQLSASPANDCHNKNRNKNFSRSNSIRLFDANKPPIDRAAHHHQQLIINAHNKRHNIANPSFIKTTLDSHQMQPNGRMIEQETANVMVGLMRLILVILICVLLVKLRAFKTSSPGSVSSSNSKRRRRRLSSSSSSSSSQNNSSDPAYHHSSTTSAASQHQNQYEGLREPRISSNNVLNQSVVRSTLIKNDQHRRLSQPNLIHASSPRSSGAGGCNDRRRRHSDTAAAAAANVLASLSLPPGPMGLPFLGYLPFLGNEIHLTLTELSDRFGPIYQIFLGGIRVVVLNDAALVRQAFKQTVFSGRPDTQLTSILQGYGIVNSDGALWKEQRAFLHSALRKLGAKSLMSGSNGLEAKIQNQVKEFVSDLSVHASEGRPCQVRPIVARAVSSVVGSIVMNLTYRKYEEKEKFDRLIELMQEGFRLFSIAMPLDFIPIFRFFPGVSYAYKKMKRNRAETSAFFQGVADEHRKYLSKTFNLGAPDSTSSLHPRTSSQQQQQQNQSCQQLSCQPHQQQSQQQTQASDPTSAQPIKPSDVVTASDASDVSNTAAGQPQTRQGNAELDNIVARDLVDAYIVQQKKHEHDGKENYFSNQQLVQIMSDIFSAGLETVTSTIEWSILFLILNPDCQTKIQAEIDQVIGRDRLPELEDLAQMPYTEATIYEVLRRSNVIALGNAHATLADATIAGYRIPKGTQVLPNLYGIHMNPKLWHEPQRFDPSRFIVNDRAQKPDYFIPFSVGRRMCLGDVLAKMEVFLFLVGLLQKYDLSVHDDDRANPPQVKGTIGVSNAPVSFRVAIKSRPCAKTTTDRNH